MLSTLALIGRLLGKSSTVGPLQRRRFHGRMWPGIEVAEARLLLSARGSRDEESGKRLRQPHQIPKFTFTHANVREFLDSVRQRLSEGSNRSKQSDLPIVAFSDYPNFAPEANDDSFMTHHDLTLNASVADNDHDPEFDLLTYSVVSGPSVGSLSLSSDGWFTYVPQALWSGTTQFVYEVTDGTGTDEATVVIDVSNFGQSAEDDEYGIALSETAEPIALYVMDNDSNYDSDTLTIQSVTSSQSGATIWIDASGTFLWYQPPTAPGNTLSIGVPFEFDFSEGTGGYDNHSDPEGFDGIRIPSSMSLRILSA